MSQFTFSEPSQIAILTGFSLLVAVNLIGNSLVCLVVIRNRSMKIPMNYLLVSLACVDMMVAILLSTYFCTRSSTRGASLVSSCASSSSKVTLCGPLAWFQCCRSSPFPLTDTSLCCIRTIKNGAFPRLNSN